MTRGVGQDIYDHEERHWWFVGRRKIVFSILDKYLPAVKGQLRLLDVGCGVLLLCVARKCTIETDIVAQEKRKK